MPQAVLDELGHDLARMARVVQSQLINALTAFFQRDTRLADTVRQRDDQVDNLLGFIEAKCFERIAGTADGGTSLRSRQLRGVFRAAMNLEKLGDYAVNVAEQAGYAARFGPRPMPFDLAGPARVALSALDEVISSFADASADKAKHACRCEPELDRQYRVALEEAFRRLAQPGADPPFIITHLFVAKFLERVGDSILNIGETTMFILTGERLKMHQYLHLEEMVGSLGAPVDRTPGVDVHQIWGGISGARVGRITMPTGGDLIWKEGDERKIDREVREIGEWNRVVPGLAPDLKGHLQRDGRESFLGAYLDGVVLRDVYLTRPWDDKVRVTRRLLETVRDIWLRTLQPEAPRLDYGRQIRSRLDELYAIHPRLEALRATPTRVFGIAHRSLEELLELVEALEPSLAPPVSVRLHGDFNTNNVIYDEARDRIHFIDVHRSGPGDYAQDIGVFLVSNLRNPVVDGTLATALEQINRLVVEFSQTFARLVGDDHFGRRLQVSQGRSLITSARVVTDPDFARGLYLKGVRFLERAVEGVA